MRDFTLASHTDAALQSRQRGLVATLLDLIAAPSGEIDDRQRRLLSSYASVSLVHHIQSAINSSAPLQKDLLALRLLTHTDQVRTCSSI